MAAQEPSAGGLVAKRLLDVVLGTIVVLAVLPVIVVLSIGVAVSLREWPFFVQWRVGRSGKLFRCPKLRTLPRNTPPYASKYDLEIDTHRFAEFLRRRHLDELPQLLVVPFGWLSLVGPRPKMPDEVEPAPTWYVELRTVMPQGCTGLWQVGNHTKELPHESPQYDVFYRRHWTLRLDGWIFWRTLLLLTGAKGPIALEDVPSWACNGHGPSAGNALS